MPTPNTTRLVALSALLLASCNTPGFAVVSFSPIYGYADACTAIKVSGAGWGDTVDVTIGGTAIDVTYPDATEHPLDVGYLVYGMVPTKPDLAEGEYADVVVTTDGNTGTMADQYRYVVCPSVIRATTYSAVDGLTPGDTITIKGCNLKGDYTAKVGPTDAVWTNVSTCEGGSDTATLTTDATIAAGSTWYLSYYAADGTELYPAIEGCDPTLPVGESLVDSGEVDENGDPIMVDACEGTKTLSFAGGE